MSCGNNKGNLGSFKGIYDFDVKYTGCSSDCGGIEIKSGDTLRNVLDALVSNCDGDGPGPGEASTNFWFSVESPTFTEDVKNGDFALTGEGEIYQFTAGSWVDTGIQIGGGTGGGGSWGEITGDITDQTDLTDYINLLISEAPVNPDNVGENIHLDEDGKLNAGRGFDSLDEANFEYTIISLKDFDPLDPPSFGDNAFLGMLNLGGGVRAELRGSTETIVAAGGTVFDEETDSVLSLKNVSGGQHTASLLAGDNQIMLGSSIEGGKIGISVYSNSVNIKSSAGESFFGPNSVIIQGALESRVGGSSERFVRLGNTSAVQHYGGIDIFDRNATGDLDILVGYWDTTNNRYSPAKIGYGYDVQTITEDMQLTHKKYVDDTVSALEATVTAQAALIADLTSRIEALEG